MRDWHTALAEYAVEFAEDLKNMPSFGADAGHDTIVVMDKPVVIRIVTEAPTPHNNYLFSKIAAADGVELEVHYVYRPTTVPGRPWKNLPDELPNVRKVRSGVGSWFDTGSEHLALSADALLFILSSDGITYFCF